MTIRLTPSQKRVVEHGDGAFWWLPDQGREKPEF